ncbi:sensor histidine kinase [Ideonella sp.]|uniref:sensor histidine kinase n=1 Tax=Ideonella sp. TaxID=1929293 RepID=UPI002B4649F9|nr:ATP-binding protein [Ideonella sp.]HJV68993.1 ATP-binding protein [Ideonella sp.]
MNTQREAAEPGHSGPGSLKRQLAQSLLTLLLLFVLICAGSLVGIHTIERNFRRLTDERLVFVQAAQSLSLQAMRLQVDSAILRTALDPQELQAAFARIEEGQGVVAELTVRLAASDDAGVLDLHSASDMLRAAASIAVQLRRRQLQGGQADAPPAGNGSGADSARWRATSDELNRATIALVEAAHQQAQWHTQRFGEAMARQARALREQEIWFAGLALATLLAGALIGYLFLGRRIVRRLLIVSRALQKSPADAPRLPLPVHGRDEIATMARRVESFLGDQQALIATRQALEGERLRLAAIIENTADAIVVARDDAVIQVNPAAETLFGRPRSALVGCTVESLVPGLSHSPALRSGITEERQALTSHGELPVEVSHSALLASGEALRVLVLRDATIHHQAEAYLRSARDAAEQARQSQSRFLTHVTHELRTPLNGVLGFAQMLQLDETLAPAQRRHVDNIARSGKHLLELIEDLLDLARIEAGRFELAPQRVVLREAIDGVMEMIALRARDQGVQLEQAIAPGTPDTLVCDPRRLRQVLINLLGNAVKFAPGEQVRLQVSSSSNDGREAVRFEVSDTGRGIAPEHQERIFQPFEQAGDAKGHVAGTGLGLAITRELVALMGGRLGLRSGVGRGSVFWFELPVAAAPTTGKAPARPVR